jgi:hypothetical protein
MFICLEYDWAVKDERKWPDMTLNVMLFDVGISKKNIYIKYATNIKF